MVKIRLNRVNFSIHKNRVVNTALFIVLTCFSISSCGINSPERSSLTNPSPERTKKNDGNLKTEFEQSATPAQGLHNKNSLDCGTEWKTANLTHYESYPEPGSEECIKYNGCFWAGQFAGLEGVQPESWVKTNNIAAVHSKDWSQLKGKTLKIRQGNLIIDVIVYDLCSDADCNGCCTENLGGDGYLVDLEKYTMQRFGSGQGIVHWQVCD